jgi:hypothetical protein
MTVGRFANRALILGAGIILSFVLSILILAGRLGALNGSAGTTGLLMIAGILFALPLLSIIVFGIRYCWLTTWRIYLELLGLCVLIWMTMWIVTPGIGALFVFDNVNEFYIDDYTRLLANEQYMMAFIGAILALVGLCGLLIWRASRLTRTSMIPVSDISPHT